MARSALRSVRTAARGVSRAALGVTLGLALAYAAVVVLCSPRARVS